MEAMHYSINLLFFFFIFIHCVLSSPGRPTAAEAFCDLCALKIDNSSPHLLRIHVVGLNYKLDCPNIENEVILNMSCLQKWRRQQISSLHINFPQLDEQTIQYLGNYLKKMAFITDDASGLVIYMALAFNIIEMMPRRENLIILNVKNKLLRNLFMLLQNRNNGIKINKYFKDLTAHHFDHWKKQQDPFTTSIVDIELKYSEIMSSDQVVFLRMILASFNSAWWSNFLDELHLDARIYQKILQVMNYLSKILPEFRAKIYCYKRFVSIKRLTNILNDKSSDTENIVSYCSAIRNAENSISLLKCDYSERLLMKSSHVQLCNRIINTEKITKNLPDSNSQEDLISAFHGQ